MEENQNEREFYTLVDDEGTEIEFELIGKAEVKGTVYYAMIPADSAEETEDGFSADKFGEIYELFKEETDESGEATLVTIDDDEEFDDVADYFDDLFSEEIDYDGQ